LIRYVAETGSTNADIAEALRAGEGWREGDWLVADRQTAGKGRQGRKWEDATGNFMGSTVVRLDGQRTAGAALNLPVSLALHAAVSEFLDKPGDILLKWPNDILLQGIKLSGILMELVDQAVVVGIGVNLAHAPVLPGRETIAISSIGTAPSRNAFAERLAFHFDQEVSRWREFGEEPLRDRWLKLAHPVGTFLSVHDVDGSRVEGHFQGLAPGGSMTLRLADGASRAIHTGDVTLD